MFKASALAFSMFGMLLGGCATDGKDGTNGTNGTNGSNGTDGSDGTNGSNGTPGPELAAPAVYTLSNQVAANQLASFRRGENGNLTRDNEYTTGGTGTAAGLGSQGALAWSKKWQRFFAVNAGNNTVSMLAIDQDGVVTTLSTIASGGTKPISVAVSGDAVYVLNYGNINGATVGANISGFKVSGNDLVAIASSTQALSGTGDVHPTDLVFTPDGKYLVVAERFGPTVAHTGMLDTFAVVNDVAQAGNFQAPAGHEPFAIDFSPEGYMITAEVGNEMANGSTASSYSISSTGVLAPITTALPTLQGAACWIVSAGGFAYIANTATSTITGLTVSTTGQLALHDASGVTATSGTTPIDLAVSPERGYLYSLAGGSHTINIYSISSDGSLTAQPALPGMPAGTSGLVAR
jgi:6-phosphogluconolactonase (cycloisomerase 2 family)